MTFPVINGRITQGFSASHPGWDIAPPTPGQTGYPCLAPEAGTIVRSAYRPSPEGNYVILHGVSGRFYYFGHFSGRLVSAGDKVAEARPVGILGKTGAATNVHTHFEVRSFLDGGSINPKSIDWEKGEEVAKVNDGDTTNYFLALFDRQPTQAELDKNRNKEWNAPDPKLRAPLYDDMIGRGRYLTEENKRLQRLVAQLGGDATVLKPGKYIVS